MFVDRRWGNRILWNTKDQQNLDWYGLSSGTLHADDWGSRFRCNVGQYLPGYVVQHPRKQLSSYTSPWEPKISPGFNFLLNAVLSPPCPDFLTHLPLYTVLLFTDMAPVYIAVCIKQLVQTKRCGLMSLLRHKTSYGILPVTSEKEKRRKGILYKWWVQQEGEELAATVFKILS
jgi:hypothetical protein